MVKLMRDNVVKIVDTKEKQAKLVDQGFRVIEDEVTKKTETETKKLAVEQAKKEAAEKKAAEDAAKKKLEEGK